MAHHLVDHRADEPMTTLTAAAKKKRKKNDSKAMVFFCLSQKSLARGTQSHCQLFVYSILVFKYLCSIFLRYYTLQLISRLQMLIESEKEPQPLIKINFSCKLTPIGSKGDSL